MVLLSPVRHKGYSKIILWAALTAAFGLCQGCVERTITINTTPDGARIWLNDELVGTSPTTVTFQWYGDYRVKIAKPGYQVIQTHRKVKAPWYDAFPFDFFAQVIWPGRVVDSHQWSFTLHEATCPTHEELVQRAQALRNTLQPNQD
ncbi:MAG: PEGA domain-containing protein [Sedimentisphaerales bacterium]|nr:PEGA domain-containing protein [Sedimentisphaerales bacterium]